jgi:hypothetical protein
LHYRKFAWNLRHYSAYAPEKGAVIVVKTKAKADDKCIVKTERVSEIRANILKQLQEAVATGFSEEWLGIKPDKPVKENFVVQIHMPSRDAITNDD